MAMVGALGCVPFLPACSVKSQPVTIGLHIWPGYEPIPLARSLGWLDDKLVKLVQTNSATDSMTLLERGKIDGAGLTLDEVLRAKEKGIPLSVLLAFDISAGADMLLAKPKIKNLTSLKGARVGVEEGALGALMLHEVLLNAGLEQKDIKIVSLTIDQHVEAWSHNEIDAIVTYEPAAGEIIQSGGKKLFNSSQIPDLIFDVLAVRTSELDNLHSEALHHLVLTHLKALKYINTNPDAASYQMATHFKLPPDQVMSAFKGLVLPDLDNNIRLLATSSPAMMKSAVAIGETMQKAGILHQKADLRGLLHPEFLPDELI
jgi:NitT/TauT family transport system substrate-binding protein